MQKNELESEPGFAVLRKVGEDGLPQYLTTSKPKQIVVATTLAEVVPALLEIEKAADSGLTAIGAIAYEAGPAFDSSIKAHPAKPGLPLLWFSLYEKTQKTTTLPSAKNNQANLNQIQNLNWQPSLNQKSFEERYNQIRQYIANGDVYQVNFTFPLCTDFYGDAYTLFRQVCLANEPLHGAYLDFGNIAIASFSPESYLEFNGDQVASRPMKGSSPRGRWFEEDLEIANALSQSEKDRAENLMIVDMVRNDLGRIARLGSVHVTDLFKVESHPTVHQLTSNITAKVDAGIAEIIRATFPPASITGAPKSRATEIIRELELTQRGIYTGCIGSIGPGRQASLNVAIRTVVIDKVAQNATYSVGSGIVWDSVGSSEYAECLLKSNILKQETRPFSLFETILWTPSDQKPEWCEAGYALLQRHIQRITCSAQYFGFSYNPEKILEALDNEAKRFGENRMRVRIQLFRRGKLELNSLAYQAPKLGVKSLAFAPEPISTSNIFLYHKTTRREVYENAKLSKPGFDDVILWNERGEICETTVANIACFIENEWITPPISSGLLPGTLRQELLNNGTLKERIITLEQAKSTSKIAVFNSVRGWQEAKISTE